MYIGFWIICGALVGWLVSILAGSSREAGSAANVAVGIVGGLIGGGLSKSFGSSGVDEFSLTSLFVALLGAAVLLLVVRVFRRTTN